MSFLASLQLFLYALLWAIGSVVHKNERPAMLHWLGYALAAAFSAAMLAWRPEGPVWLTHTGSSLATLLSLVLGGRGALLFMRLPPRNGFWLGLCGMALLLQLLIGPHNAAARVGSTALLGVLVLAVSYALAWRAFLTEFGPRVALAATLPVLALLGLNLYFVLQWLLRVPVDVLTPGTVSTATWVVTLVSAAVFNFLFVFLVAFRLQHILRRQATHDALTGLPNRRAMQQRLQLEWERSRRYGSPFVAIAIDIDFFKQINDQHGHSIGDRALLSVAQTLQAHVRDTDHVSRFGGEEFLVLMPQAQAALDGVRLAERLRAAVAALQLYGTDAATLPLHASFGVAESLLADTDSEQVLRRADQALYQAKEQGRNRVVLHDSVSEPQPVPRVA